MKKFWMLVLAGLFVMNSGAASLWAEDVQSGTPAPAVTETVAPAAEDALLTDETVLEDETKNAAAPVKKEAADAAVEEEAATDDEFSDSLAMEGDKAESTLEDMTSASVSAENQTY